MAESKLDKNNIENFMSLTSLQQGILFHYINDKYSSMYHEQLSLSVKGDIKLDLLQKSLKFVIGNNEMLRTVFRWENIDKPVQIVLERHEIPIQYIDLTGEIDKINVIENLKLNDLNKKLVITEETLRIYLCKLDEYKHEIIISNHHILYDGWSNGIILKELMQTYTNLYMGKDIKKNSKTKFSEFIRYINSLNKDTEKKHWTNYLQNLECKDDYFHCKEIGNYKTVSYKICKSKSNIIKNFSKNNRILLSSIFYGAWGVLLQILSNSNEVLFGTTVSGRPESIKSVDNMVGLFINTIPLRVTSDNDTTLLGVIHDLDKVLNERKDFENTSLVDIKKYCGLKANEDLFNSIVTIENYPIDLNINKENILFIEKFSIVEKTNYNMSIEILTFDEIEFKFTFNSLSINDSLVNQLGSYIERIINNLINNTNIKLSKIELITESEKNRLLYEFNNTKVDYPKYKTIQEFFEAKVERTPEKLAVIFEDNKLTYKEINEKANYIARELRNKGIRADSIVGIMIERSLEMLIGILGILKSGGAYLPINPNAPNERVEYIINDSNCKLLMTTKDLIKNINSNIEFMELPNIKFIKDEVSNLNRSNNSENLAYVIYTSGSTGEPKGVAIEHRSVINTLMCMEENYSVMDNDVCLLKTSYTFDVSVTELFGWFIGNGSLAILGKSEETDMNKIINAIDKYKVTHVNFIPSLLAIFNDTLDYKLQKINSLKYVFAAGEVLKENIAKDFLFKTQDIMLENIYGPTEASIYASKYSINKNLKHINIPIGKPLHNTKVYIINEKNNNLVPLGFVGELCISGDGLARGYINRPELTVEKFVDNPFEIGTKMYKTGDLARWLIDGNIEFLGRTDNQVKIRGFRIELGEIENRILQHEDVKEAVVIDREDANGNKYICAYVVSKKEVYKINLKSYLKESLPEYMVPSYFINLEKMPLKSNGKLDRKALPEPILECILNEYEAPRNELEEKLSNIWSEVLEVKKIGINDDFFDIGGNSISALRIINKVRSKLKLDISIKFLFQYSNIKIFSEEILKLKNSELVELCNVHDSQYYPLSYNQKRLWIINQLNPDSNAYNINGIITINSKLSKMVVEKCFRNLIERHESLRTGFKVLNGKIVQFVINVENIPFEYIDISFEDNKKINNIKMKYVNQYGRTKFDLSNPPLIKGMFIKLKQNHCELIVTMHHIVSDGWSLDILKKEFYELIEAYSKNENPKLEKIQFKYRDFAVWQNSIINNQTIKMKAIKFWHERFEEIPILKVQPDYIGYETTLEGATYVCFIKNRVKKQIKEVAKKNRTSLFMVMFSAYNLLISQLTAQNDIVCSVANAGREVENLQDVVGFFVNSVIIKTHINYEEDFTKLLKRVTGECLEIFEYANYPIEIILEEFGMSYPDVKIAFNMINIAVGVQIDDIDSYHIARTQDAKADIALEVNEYTNTIELRLNYRKNMYLPSTIENIANMYLKIIDYISTNEEE